MDPVRDIVRSELAPLALGDPADLGQDALDFLEIGPSGVVQARPAALALEMLGVGMLLRGAGAVGDGGGGHLELLAGMGEVPQPGRPIRRSAGSRGAAGKSRIRAPGTVVRGLDKLLLPDCTNASFSVCLPGHHGRSADAVLNVHIEVAAERKFFELFDIKNFVLTLEKSPFATT